MPDLTEFLAARIAEEQGAARLRIVEAHTGAHPCPGGDVYFDADTCLTLRLLATPYADHPDYDESWRP